MDVLSTGIKESQNLFEFGFGADRNAGETWADIFAAFAHKNIVFFQRAKESGASLAEVS
jgi:hypothetical protein